MRVAFTTIGVRVDDWDQPRVKGSVDRAPDVFRAAEGGDGFLDRARRYGSACRSRTGGRWTRRPTCGHPYGPDGVATAIDPARVKEKIARNASK